MRKIFYGSIVVVFIGAILFLNFYSFFSSSTTVSYQGQQFTIIPAYEGMVEYVEQARKSDEDEREKIFEKTVLEPFTKEFWGQTFDIYSSLPIQMIKDIDKLEESINLLKNSNATEIIAEALKTSASYLSGPNIKVYVLALDPDRRFEIEHMKGLYGIAYGNGNILIMIDPHSPWEELLPYLVAHEYHHEVVLGRIIGGYHDGTLLSTVIIEGKADTFASIVYPEVVAPWTIALSYEEEKAVWEKMSVYLNIDTYGIVSKFQFGHSGLNIPQWSGYKVGYQIMQDLLANEPELTISEWTNMRNEEILRRSRFEERFN
ncbi:hypothetical protein DS745_23210 [Anaerobacillus alkaliphilus]|uniref:DUF2268 domain-containing protein n=1 Tax=Anaerobacillus alkaliphilus TaxID=1548597 RepID=A0A4Q0VP27_9BACI|nr:DUF2268 domain-containing putative Zn-dependent protease [Anaerobacillus alkaliphilus]RXI96612.1 hypothetical protein DS745_23210 [Anaerobacillus alkaliphilus]